jgi:hypothetical protein
VRLGRLDDREHACPAVGWDAGPQGDRGEARP